MGARSTGIWKDYIQRIIYKKILGSKNPADSLTKHMTADLAQRHLETLNMQMSGGRASSAPTIDSLVKAWYEGGPKRKDPMKIKFNSVIQYLKIPAIGSCRIFDKVNTNQGIKTKWVRQKRSRT